MNRLIEDLLEVVRQESGRMRLAVEGVSAASLVAQAAEMFQTTALEKGITLRVEQVPPDLEVCADAERVVQVLSNLLGNAMKFVPRGGSVVLNCERKEVDAVCSVADSGPGIPEGDLDRLFEKFWQRRRSDRRGVGLGLTIARGIVEGHGGRIWAESHVGVGSTFYFTLPVVSRQPEELLPAISSLPLVNNIPAEVVA
jgi:signal transduction histidine kinase